MPKIVDAFEYDDVLDSGLSENVTIEASQRVHAKSNHGRFRVVQDTVTPIPSSATPISKADFRPARRVAR